MKRKLSGSALVILAVLSVTTATVMYGNRAQADDLVTATVQTTAALANVVVAATHLVTVPIYAILGLNPHPVAYVPAPGAPMAAAPIGYRPPPFAVASPTARPMVGGYYAQ
ncbi:MAG: hypothetical protein HQL74_05640 [Magnetococcales bacterium]|nr:hypothetical protein [Magnetococcales bacterium]